MKIPHIQYQKKVVQKDETNRLTNVDDQWYIKAPPRKWRLNPERFAKRKIKKLLTNASNCGNIYNVAAEAEVTTKQQDEP